MTDVESSWSTPVTWTCPLEDENSLQAYLKIDVGGGGVFRKPLQSTNASGDCLTGFTNLNYCTGNTYAFEVPGALPSGATVWSAILFKLVSGELVFQKEFFLQADQNASVLSLESQESIQDGTWKIILKASNHLGASFAGIQLVSRNICGVVTGNGSDPSSKTVESDRIEQSLGGSLSPGCALRVEGGSLQRRGDFAWLGLIALFLGFLALFRFKIKND